MTIKRVIIGSGLAVLSIWLPVVIASVFSQYPYVGLGSLATALLGVLGSFGYLLDGVD